MRSRLPESLPAERAELFERRSIETTRHIHPVLSKHAEGLVKQVYDMVAEDFFINGAISSHSKSAELMAGAWIGLREIVLVGDHLSPVIKAAMGATASQINESPQCEDMFLGLLHGFGEHDAALQILNRNQAYIPDLAIRERCIWVEDSAMASSDGLQASPFTPEEMPEALGSLLVVNYFNNFSRVVIKGSPIVAPFGLQSAKDAALRMLGFQLRPLISKGLEPGKALPLLTSAQLPMDMNWAKDNSRIADALSRWAGAIERQSQGVNEHIARLSRLVAKSSEEIDGSLVESVLGEDKNEERLIKVLAWASFSSARRLATIYQSKTEISI